jgi:hypothetical protein
MTEVLCNACYGCYAQYKRYNALQGCSFEIKSSFI